MGEIRPPRPVMLFASIIYNSEAILQQAIDMLEERIEKISDKTMNMPFKHTDYYSEEMGLDLFRIFVLFDNLVERECLVETKLKTNSIEKVLSMGNKRQVNIDPGYISLENIILATTKNYTHRIYLGNGIYADLTLIYNKGTYRPLEWTYPDYGSSDIISIFNRWREYYKRKPI